MQYRIMAHWAGPQSTPTVHHFATRETRDAAMHIVAEDPYNCFADRGYDRYIGVPDGAISDLDNEWAATRTAEWTAEAERRLAETDATAHHSTA